MNNVIDQIADMMDDDDSEDQFGICSPSQLMLVVDDNILSFGDFNMAYGKAIEKATEMDCPLDIIDQDLNITLRQQIIDGVLLRLATNIENDKRPWHNDGRIRASTDVNLHEVLDELEYEEFLALDDEAKNYIHNKYGYTG